MVRVDSPVFRPRRFVPGWMVLSLFLLATPLLAAEPGSKLAEKLSKAQALLEGGRPEAAMEILDGVLARGKPDAEALLLRSSGRIMLGNLSGGIDDLRRATQVDPSLRQAWLNLAGIEIAQRRFESGYEALLEAQKLDPSAPDNDANLGAVLLMLGKSGEASGHFARYLEQEGASADAYYLVASNYALAGMADPAVDHLRQAILLNERLRVRARSDERFLSLDAPEYDRLVVSDLYQPPADAFTAAAAFKVRYDVQDNRLLYAVLGALRSLQIEYDPAIESTERWALVWADLRIKVTNQSNGTGVVHLSAPADRYTTDSWQRVSQRLFQTIHQVLNS